MNCSQTRKMISPYVDDELGPEEKELFLTHIEGCPQCNKELQEVGSIHRLFAGGERFEAPLGFTTRVMGRIEEREQVASSFWSFFILQPAFVRVVEVSLAVVVILIGVVSGNLLVPNRASERQPGVEQSLSLDLFQVTPPGSIGAFYASLAGATDER